jgi:signal transduction histidine kinase
LDSQLYAFRLFIKGGALRAPVSLHSIVDEVFRLLAGEASTKRVVLERELDAELPDVVADRVQLQQLVRNLIVNAFEAMDPVLDRPKRLLVRAYRDGADGTVVEIRDSGIGMTDPARAFDLFYTTKPNGMGMGLSICRSIVEAHHGALWVKPHAGPGTTVYFRLPVQWSLPLVSRPWQPAMR